MTVLLFFLSKVDISSLIILTFLEYSMFTFSVLVAVSPSTTTTLENNISQMYTHKTWRLSQKNKQYHGGVEITNMCGVGTG
ncbi:hypothetical protein M5K25_008309 [Dendrobium thyrsiflorum]|uniref:Uncharacterized protein n=1 Tax=Dendrobium thyrsiflorum TaxID=117978 RepID=A0ABD0VF51_DENTH